MMRHLVPAVAACALLLSGCYTVRFGSVENAASQRGYKIHTWTHSLFWGILPLGRVNIDQCGTAGVKSMKSQVGGLGLIAYAVTGGIWTPMHVKIVCADPATSLVPDPAEDGALVWVEPPDAAGPLAPER